MEPFFGGFLLNKTVANKLGGSSYCTDRAGFDGGGAIGSSSS